jgi:hypothetical protein
MKTATTLVSIASLSWLTSVLLSGACGGDAILGNTGTDVKAGAGGSASSTTAGGTTTGAGGSGSSSTTTGGTTTTGGSTTTTGAGGSGDSSTTTGGGTTGAGGSITTTGAGGSITTTGAGGAGGSSMTTGAGGSPDACSAVDCGGGYHCVSNPAVGCVADDFLRVCGVDGDCTVFNSYCRQCDCLAISTAPNIPPPKCDGNTVQCLVAPCSMKKAVCVSGECVVK